MKRIIIFFLIVLVLLSCVAVAEASETDVFTISLDKEIVSVETGKSATVKIHVDAPKGEEWSIGGEVDNQYICTASITAMNGADISLSITGTGAGVGILTVYVENHPETTKEIEVHVSMSKEEKAKAEKVQYISDRSFFLYENEDAYVLLFSFKDINENRIDCPATVAIRIENDDGVVVYEKTRYVTVHDFGTWSSAFYGERYLASIYIAPEDIEQGTTSSGNVFFTVLVGDGGFDESKVTTSELPKLDLTSLCSLDLPELPNECKYSSSSGKVYSKANITQLSYEFIESYDGTVGLHLYFSGQKTYDYKGNSNSDSCKIGWKLYDEEGYVIKSGTCYTSALATGEKFKNEEDVIYNLEPGHYSIKLINVE